VEVDDEDQTKDFTGSVLYFSAERVHIQSGCQRCALVDYTDDQRQKC
jgi:hypothetical protein